MALMSKSGGGGGFSSGVRAYDPAFGGIPSISNPAVTAGAAIGGNIGNLGALYQLGSGLNTFNTGQAINQIGQGLPNYGALVGQSSKNIGAELQGQVPQDVITQLLQGAAERGIMTGTSGSPNSNAAYLRALGLTSLGQMQQGEQNLTGAIARTPRPGLFDPTSMFVSPQQQQEAQVTQNYLNAAPVPSAAGTVGLGAAHAGLRAGLGSISTPAGAGGLPAPPGSSIYNPFAPGYNPATTAYGATNPQEAPNAAQVAANWADWARSLPGNANPTTYTMEDFANEFPDLVGELADPNAYSGDIASD